MLTLTIAQIKSAAQIAQHIRELEGAKDDGAPVTTFLDCGVTFEVPRHLVLKELERRIAEGHDLLAAMGITLAP